MDSRIFDSKEGREKVPRRTFLEVIGAAVTIGLPGIAAGQEKVGHSLPINADMWILGGQSNMCILGYRSLQSCGELDHPVHIDRKRVRVFGLDNKWADPIEPVHWFFTAAAPIYRDSFRQQRTDLSDADFARIKAAPRPQMLRQIGPGTAFAKHIIDNTNRNIALIPCALGGASMDMWDPALKDQDSYSLYGAMMNRIQLVGGDIAGILWNQGESDFGSPSCYSYKKKMLNFIDNVRRDTGKPNLPIIYVQLADSNFRNPATLRAVGGLEIVREAQRQIALERKNAYVIANWDAPWQEPGHVGVEGQEIIGRRMAEVALSEVYHVAGHGRSINLRSLRIDRAPRGDVVEGSPVIHLHFSGVTGRLHTPCRGQAPFFELRLDTPPRDTDPTPFRTDFDPEDPGGVIVRIQGQFSPTARLYYGSGLKPYCNIVDDAGMMVPAFGPIDVYSLQKSNEED